MVRLAYAMTFGTLALLVTGCSSIRVVKKTPDGGVVALQGIQSDARNKAQDYMRSQCAGEYDVVEEGEAVVGSDTTTRKTSTFLGPATTSQSSDRAEWRITYRCKGAKAAVTRTLFVRL
jgi:hypothetical protein